MEETPLLVRRMAVNPDIVIDQPLTDNSGQPITDTYGQPIYQFMVEQHYNGNPIRDSHGRYQLRPQYQDRIQYINNPHFVLMRTQGSRNKKNKKSKQNKKIKQDKKSKQNKRPNKIKRAKK